MGQAKANRLGRIECEPERERDNGAFGGSAEKALGNFKISLEI